MAPAAEMTAFPARPPAKRRMVSLVEVSPSTVIRLKLVGRAWRRSVFKTWGVAAASVKIKTKSVAISGWIMPEPLAMPARVNFLPSIFPCTSAALGRVSVVMMARAASPNPSGCSPATKPGQGLGDPVPGQGGADDPGGRRQHQALRDVKQLGGRPAGGPGGL